MPVEWLIWVCLCLFEYAYGCKKIRVEFSGIFTDREFNRSMRMTDYVVLIGKLADVSSLFACYINAKSLMTVSVSPYDCLHCGDTVLIRVDEIQFGVCSWRVWVSCHVNACSHVDHELRWFNTVIWEVLFLPSTSLNPYL